MMKKFTAFIRALYEKEVDVSDKTITQISLSKEQISISMRDELKDSAIKLKEYQNREKKKFLEQKEKGKAGLYTGSYGKKDNYKDKSKGNKFKENEGKSDSKEGMLTKKRNREEKDI